MREGILLEELMDYLVKVRMDEPRLRQDHLRRCLKVSARICRQVGVIKHSFTHFAAQAWMHGDALQVKIYLNQCRTDFYAEFLAAVDMGCGVEVPLHLDRAVRVECGNFPFAQAVGLGWKGA